MYKFFLFLLVLILSGVGLDAQQMQWVPGEEVGNPDYKDATNCADNVICYALAYTPAKSGTLTSYTTNFLVDCDGGKSAIISNRSLVMTDNSAQEEACEEAGVLLLNASGNTGSVNTKSNGAIYLHEICIQTSRKSTAIEFKMDEIGALTTSLDIPNGKAVTERPDFQPFLFKRAWSSCSNTPDVSFAGEDFDVAADETIGRDGIELSLSPNPAVDQINVRLDHPGTSVDFSLLDGMGRVVGTWTAATNASLEIDVSQLPAGFYHLNAQTDQETFTKKFIVRK